ncbi:MAG: hypothetical protein NTW74_21715 [Acidobacteria bacterium]|nr:hypothetical protein [Acidobacteriota bacterium]
MHLDDENLKIPEPDSDFEKRIWARVSAEMGARPGVSHKFLWMLVPAALAIAFFVGRSSKDPEIVYLPQQQLLQAATSEHLERSKLVLIETANGAAPLAQARAEELLSTNRLLRRGAQEAGELQTAELLEELERVLLEVAHSSETMKPEEATALRARIREQGLLFRVRLLENKNKQNTELTD